MQLLKINFIDFWPQLDKKNNYFYNILSTKYTVVIEDESPDIIFFSVFGEEHLNFTCKKIFFTGENITPDFSSCDLAFSFDFLAHKKHFRLPLYSIYYEHFESRNMLSNIDVDFAKKWLEKTKFCCMVVSNPKAKERIDFFKKLSTYQLVDSGGKVLNNVGGPVDDKLDFIKDYKFVISFENEMNDGYTTEKILEPIIKNCIPIYWGNKFVEKDFNANRFLNYHNFASEEDLIAKILYLKDNPKEAIKMISAPMLSSDRISFEKEKENVLHCLESVINSHKKPLAKTLKGYIYKNRKRYSNGRILKYSRYHILKFFRQ